jgi:thiamine-phosphate pyrophosphorylase
VTSGAALREALRLVVILDQAAARGRALPALGASAVKGGATMLQVRAKQLPPAALAELVRTVIAATSVPVLVNDRLDVALATGAAGCHLGQDDFPIAEARIMAPSGFILGGSAGNPDEARRAAVAGAHYLGVGPIHVTGHKPDAGEPIGAEGFEKVQAATTLPCVAIGGITIADAQALRAAGAAGLAVIGAVLGAQDTEDAARDLVKAWH